MAIYIIGTIALWWMLTVGMVLYERAQGDI